MALAMRFLPELGGLILALLIFLVSVGIGHEEEGVSKEIIGARRARAAAVAQRLTLFGAFLVLVLSALAVRQEGPLFFGAYDVTLLAQITKILLSVGLLGSVWLVGREYGIPERDKPEFLLFLVLGTVGMMMLVSANDLVTFYVALEIAAYCLYITVPLARGFGHHNEASFKYFLYGATASAVALYGMSLLYGLSGTVYLPDIAAALSQDPSGLATGAVVLAIGGVLFKLAVFPFHFWAPDTYETASHGTASFIAGASKVGAVAALLRLLLLGAELERMVWVLGGLAVLSMTYGNLAALVQKDLKRLIAYSGVAQAGYIVLGLIGRDADGYTATLYYAAGYMLLILLCFGVVTELGRQRQERLGATDQSLPIADLRGLYGRAPTLALALLIGILGLAGVPPTIGFTGKWLLFKAAVDNGAFWLVLVAGINNTIAVYYYLIVVKSAFVDPPEDAEPVPESISTRAFALSLSGAVVLLGIFPQWVVPAIARAAEGLF